jgi:amino acid adenylation domain-containing protein
VQLPTDAQRAATSGYERAHASLRPLKPSTSETAATIVGALAAVLFRFTQQETVSIDLYQSHPSTPGRKHARLSFSVVANEPVSALAVQAAGAFAALHGAASGLEHDIRGNIAVSFLDASEGRASGLANADSYDVHFVVGSEPTTLEVAYNRRLFEAATIERLADAVGRVFETALAQPATPISSLPVLSAAELHAITVDWDSGHSKYPAEPVHRVFERLARERPRAPAVSFEGQSLTYGALDARSSQLAHHLRACGVTPGGAVAVCVVPSLDIAVAFLAIWKAGAVYVPLDPTHPEALIATILDEVRPGVVLTQSKLRSLTNPERHAQFCFDTDAPLLAEQPATAPAVTVTLDDPAYVLYTSGTTGKPKGVDARHSNLAHYVHVARQKYGFRHDDAFCSLARYTFSISLFELVLPLCCGASVKLLARDDVLAPERLARTLDEVTVVHAGPSLLGNLFRYLRSSASQRQTFPRMRHASSGGDLVPPTVGEEMKRVFENAELFVIYGCTEISCMGCTYPILRDRPMTRTFVGKPFWDVVVRLTDPAGNIVPLGAVGEICFAGKGLVRGYLQRPELTAEKFVERDGRCFYLTGDLGRLHPDGNVEILGRRDYQIQLRGIRVELPGIENTVRAIGLAEQCAVAVKKLSDEDVRLVAFAVKPRENTIAAFRRTLAAHLPDYMLPQGLVVIDSLPLTRNGKLDRAALQALPWQSVQDTAPSEAPRSTVERQIAAAFAKALGVADVGLDDDFFDRGGHSLLAVVMLQELESTLGLTLPPDLLFEHSTVRGLAEQARGTMQRDPRPIPLSQDRNRPALYMLLGVQLYRPLARRLEGEYSVFGVYAARELLMLDTPDLAPTVPELASEYTAIIRQHQPTGPYRIAGMSFGGLVAYEVAQQLRAAGAEVNFVGLIDAVLPESGRRYRVRQLARLLRQSPREMLRVIGQRVRGRLGALVGARPKSEFTRYDGQEQLAPIEDRRLEVYARAAESYVPHIRPLPGNVELIVAQHRLDADPLQAPDCGWCRRFPSIRLHGLDSDHLGLVEEPTVARLAEIFLESLRRVEGTDGSRGRDEPQTSAETSGHSGSLLEQST